MENEGKILKKVRKNLEGKLLKNCENSRKTGTLENLKK